MDTNSKNNETYLSDWLAGIISDGELRAMVGDAEFAAFEKLKNSIERLHLEEPDMERNYAAIKSKRINQFNARKTRTIPLYNYIAVAASLFVLFGLFQFFVYSNSVQTKAGDHTSLTMSDGSQITVNSRSCLEYPSLFKYNRKIRLDGEAYFEVKKGGSFLVKTAEGTVEVLGTKFNVISRSGFFEVVCYEGKVEIRVGQLSNILTKGQAFRFFESKPEVWDETEARPQWIFGETSFRKLPLQHVITQLQNQYDIKIQYPETLKNLRFTGSFTHSNINTAIQTICVPLNLNYRKTTEGNIIITE